MFVLNKDLFFHSVDYSILINFNSVGGVSGVFRPLTSYGSEKEYPYKGCYHNPGPEVINLAFTIEWSPSTEDECDFTCFSGQILKDNILVLDWMLVNQKDENNYAVSGSSFLYSPLYLYEQEKTLLSVKPFPINIKLVET